MSTDETQSFVFVVCRNYYYDAFSASGSLFFTQDTLLSFEGCQKLLKILYQNILVCQGTFRIIKNAGRDLGGRVQRVCVILSLLLA